MIRLYYVRCVDKVQTYHSIFFIKQKTAYEIYQCDWSSDVCSSDLSLPAEHLESNAHEQARRLQPGAPADSNADQHRRDCDRGHSYPADRGPLARHDKND